MAQKTIDELLTKARVLETTAQLPRQAKLVLLAILELEGQAQIYTGDVLRVYRELCAKAGARELTERRVGGIISEFVNLGFIKAEVVSLGRHGLMRQITLQVSKSLVPELKEGMSRGLFPLLA